MAAPFDLDRLKVTGESVPVLPDVMQAINPTNNNIATFAAQFSFSDSGTMAFVPGGKYPDRETRPVLVDKNGTIRPLGKTERSFFFPRVSSAQKKIAFWTYGENRDIWTYDMSAGFYQPLVRSRDYNALMWHLWTPDGGRLAYQEIGAARSAIYWTNAVGSGEPEFLVEDGIPASWSPDGKSLAFIRSGPGTGYDIWILSVENKKAEPFLNTQSYEGWPEFSPDGRFLAYASDVTGRYEVYVTPYPGNPRGVRVSDQGGHIPVWSPDMSQLYYLEISQSPRAKMIVADISTDPSFRVLNRRVLFDCWGLGMSGYPLRGYDILPDGQGFVCQGYLSGGKAIYYSDIPPDILDGLATQDMKSLAWFERWLRQDKDRVLTPELERMLQGLAVTKINIVQNWFEELNRFVPSGKK
jgi:Tol biopolymer transport system component